MVVSASVDNRPMSAYADTMIFSLSQNPHAATSPTTERVSSPAPSTTASSPTPTEVRRQLRAATAMHTEAERIIRYQIQQAIKLGMSWADIAECLGVTRQSAHRKYAKTLPRELRK